MTLTINLPADIEQKLAERAATAGQDMAGYVYQLIRKDVAQPLSFDEVCAPFAKAVEASGMSDEELENFFEEVREQILAGKAGLVAPEGRPSLARGARPWTGQDQ